MTTSISALSSSITTKAFRDACSRMDEDYSFAGLYDLRLKISQTHPLVHIQELLYTEVETDTRKSGEKQFDYVDPRNRAVQVEMEMACTHHLKCINAWLEPHFREIKFDDQSFEHDASVVIPVRNRVRDHRRCNRFGAEPEDRVQVQSHNCRQLLY
ncbi:MAG: hypothetical protein MZV63_21215 [Marinilabiliales bacterium]|nr:hypothetical protein [Marinilabiliales bacterium]